LREGKEQQETPMEDLAGRSVLITGSSRGIGAAVARGMGAAHMRVGVHWHTARAEAERVCADIRAAGGEAALLEGDIAAPGTVERLIGETVAAVGRIDVRVTNAADLIERRPAADTSDELFERHIALNVRPVFAACRAVVHCFRAQPRHPGYGAGSIINVSSIAARTGGGGGSSLYAGAKAFVAAFSRALAREVAADGIRVNCVSPGVLSTPLQDRVTPAEVQAAWCKQIPLGRIGAAEEAVGAFLFFASDSLSGYLTGQVIEVNGGLLMP
jgi:3-oxoacyl-[acyl-carrier protein] reductase